MNLFLLLSLLGVSPATLPASVVLDLANPLTPSAAEGQVRAAGREGLELMLVAAQIAGPEAVLWAAGGGLSSGDQGSTPNGPLGTTPRRTRRGANTDKRGGAHGHPSHSRIGCV